MKKLIQIAAISGVMFAATAQAQVTLINDSFTDGNRTNGADANDAQWYLIGGGTSVTDIGSVISVPSGSNYASTGVLRVTSRVAAVANPHWVTTFNSTTLGVGDKLSLSFTFSTTDAANTANGLRFGFYNSGGTSQTGDLAGANVNTLYQDDVGYTVFAPHGNTGSTVQLYQRNTSTLADVTLISTTAPSANVALPGTATTTVSTAGSATPTTFTATLELTRTASGYSYTSTYGGANLSGSTTVVTTSTFDTLELFAAQAQNTTTYFDDVVVTYTSAIPEPSTFAALAGGLVLAGSIGLRRRRSRV